MARNPGGAATELPNSLDLPIEAGPASVPGFRFCTVTEFDRLLRVLEGGAMLVDTPITPGMRIALAVQQMRIALSDAQNGVSVEGSDAVRVYLTENMCVLINQVLGPREQIEVAVPQPPDEPPPSPERTH